MLLVVETSCALMEGGHLWREREERKRRIRMSKWEDLKSLEKFAKVCKSLQKFRKEGDIMHDH